MIHVPYVSTRSQPTYKVLNHNARSAQPRLWACKLHSAFDSPGSYIPIISVSGITHSLSLAVCGLWVFLHLIHCIGILALERFCSSQADLGLA